jgi:hypothetical protein
LSAEFYLRSTESVRRSRGKEKKQSPGRTEITLVILAKEIQRIVNYKI